MHLFETENGDRWVCSLCASEEEEMIKEKKWVYIFDRHEPTLRCSLCKHPDIDYDD